MQNVAVNPPVGHPTFTLLKILVKGYFDKYQNLLRFRSNDENILNVGCGDGSVTAEVIYPRVQKYLGNLVALEHFPDFITYAEKHHAKDKIQYRYVNVKTADDVWRISGSYDHIFSFYSGHWTVGQRSLYKHFYDILKPGGQVFVAIILNNYLNDTCIQIINDAFPHLNPENESLNVCPNYGGEPVSYMKKLLRKIGFEVELCIEETQKIYADVHEEFVTALLCLHPFISRYSLKTRRKCIQQYIADRTLSAWADITIEPEDESQMLTVEHEALLFVATKTYSN